MEEATTCSKNTGEVITLEKLCKLWKQIPEAPKREVIYSKYVPKGNVYRINTEEFKKIQSGFLVFPLYEFDEMIVIGIGEQEKTSEQ